MGSHGFDFGGMLESRPHCTSDNIVGSKILYMYVADVSIFEIIIFGIFMNNCGSLNSMYA